MENQHCGGIDVENTYAPDAGLEIYIIHVHI